MCRLIAYYRSCGLGPDSVKYALDSITCLRGLCSTKHHLILLGDFNLPDADWTCYNSPNNQIYNAFMDFINEFGLIQFVQFSTRQDNILDLIFSNDKSLISAMKDVGPLNTSDHTVITFTFNCRITSPNKLIIPKRNYYRANYELLNNYFSNINWDWIFQICFSADECWNAFRDIILDVTYKFIPTDQKRKIQKGRFSRNRSLYRAKAELWRRWRETGDENDLIKYKQFEKKTNYLIRQRRVQTELDLVGRANLNVFYKYINRKLFNHTSLGEIQCDNNSLTSDPEKIAIFNDYFASVFTSDDENAPDFCMRTNTQIDNVVFTPEIVTRILKTLNGSTSIGPDGIPNVLLKKCAHSLALPLCHIFDVSVRTCKLPHEWKTTLITPIHKKGPTSLPTNYRPISLTCTCCRVMERIVNKNILAFLLNNGLIKKQQHGFLESKSTCTNLLECVYDWTIALQSKKSVDVVYFDYQKAFDSVSHPKLLQKIQCYGITNNLLLSLSDFLLNRTQRVRVNEILSEPRPVPQGSVLGPTLFLIFINDIVDNITKASVSTKLFADDIKLYAYSESNQHLQDAITELTHWSDRWQLRLTSDKCFTCCVRSRSRKNHKPSHYFINSQQLTQVPLTRDLGVYIDEGLTFVPHIKNCDTKSIHKSPSIKPIIYIQRQNHSYKGILLICSPATWILLTSLEPPPQISGWKYRICTEKIYQIYSSSSKPPISHPSKNSRNPNSRTATHYFGLMPYVQNSTWIC